MSKKHAVFLGAIVAIQSLLAIGCDRSHPTNPRHEITGPLKERIERSTATLEKHFAIPGSLVDVHLAEDMFDNSGGLVPGPSDSNFFGVIAIKPNQRTWKSGAKPLGRRKILRRIRRLIPSPLPEWWPKIADFTDSEFHNPATLTGRNHGFLFLSPSRMLIVFSVM